MDEKISGEEIMETVNMMTNKTETNPVESKLLMSSNPILSCQLDGKGSCVSITSETIVTTKMPCWIHLDYTNPETIAWFNATTLLPEAAKSALIEHNQIPKEMRFDNAMLVILRGVNATPNNLPDPIISFRFYITNNLIISTRHQKIDAITSLKIDLEKGVGPVDVADWLIQVSDLLADQAMLSFENIHNRVVKIEDNVLNQRGFSHKDIGRTRKQLILLRRLLTPERDIFVKIATERLSWIDDNDRQHLHDISTRFNYLIADIDTTILRIASLMEQINALLTESMNKRIYWMTLYTIIFLPITFIASLLGVNLAGIPFSAESWAFGLLVIFLFVIALAIAWILKSKKWF